MISVQIGYTYNHLVATLAIIETPTAIPIIKTSPQDDKKDIGDPDAPLLTPGEKVAFSGAIEQELLLVKQKPITSKLRTTIRHLTSRGGFFARFRGFMLFIINVSILMILNIAASAIFGEVNRALEIVTMTGFYVILARLNTAWIHAVISEPSSKTLFQRIPPRSAFKKLAAPAAINSFVQLVGVYAPECMYHGLGLSGYIHNPDVFKHMSKMQFASVCLATVLLVSVTILLLVVCFPVHVAYTRVQASLLPEDDEPIVPFDRTFGGKVVPELLGGSGMIGMWDAWKTFDWNATIRVVKVYVKTFFMQLAVFILFLAAVAVELRLMLGPQMDKIIRDGMRKGRGQPDLEFVVN